MANVRIHKQKLLREAEGYLDLLMVFADRWPPSAEVRDPLAQRALNVLAHLQKHPGNQAHVLYLTGQAYRAMEQHADAVTPLKQACKMDPENVHYWLALAWCYKRSDRLDLAIESLEEALDGNDTEAIVYYNLACYWSLANNAKIAVPYLSRAFDLDVDFRDLVALETDFDPIRQDAEFLALTSVIV